MPDRLDYVHFEIDYHETSLAIMLALELAERAARTHDADARSVGAKIRRAGASGAVRLSGKELAAFAGVIDAWQADAETVRALREQLPSS